MTAAADLPLTAFDDSAFDACAGDDAAACAGDDADACARDAEDTESTDPTCSISSTALAVHTGAHRDRRQRLALELRVFF